MFFLLKRFLVLNLSLRSNQKKNLCLPKFPEDQSQEKRGRLLRALKENVSFLKLNFLAFQLYFQLSKRSWFQVLPYRRS